MNAQKKDRIVYISTALDASGHQREADLVLELLQESENRMIALLFMIVLNIALVATKLWGA